MFLKVMDAQKAYGEGESKVQVLKGATFTLEESKICTILGPSGSGKSTLLNVIGGLEGIDVGEVNIDNILVSSLNSEELAAYRREKLGFIFQFYNLIPNLTVKENIEVCEYLTDDPLNKEELLASLGLLEHQDKFPRHLSGGQQQRTAIARALIKNPKLLLCDEPTGALDYKTSKEILELLESVNERYGTTMIIVTHNDAIKYMSHKVVKVRDGRIEEEYENDTIMKAKDITW
ncbi:putative ABC transport system ATP-binding protein [Clostridium saccharoperbutylacetonicum]|jgi:putative ABC transport system ATP-binding protein|uniref:ABC-type antimicrobial peptide transport system, ATPase component n=1 Tax=Clostridium saccharoperbutylacetonicum N1-4(HMT) TaxID=931276 RepID=M1LY57_9CLOT|nr:ABC transporter ATP-binding protein [Clostridium saccharoperbutylacetonicum]AGF58190.1 ABC-type antimicrobial peptide transport system, ATPase component [Clostridium saccharoperbutylacetonicum N1-4(HMT)]NRT61036.1 putative ABC transport system ATP-binding protein [Clostridium saccharoperbutylacetonicum]NSB24351.1 putative ABC transport system ATP-binding protein [Clostridium saccharoperbutylacetonicum]NSB43727.1 putative ABC transport system ATP-binding protein [Clostridium saccharoperbutyla